MNHINELVITIRDIMGRLKIVESAGQLVKVDEIGPNSFVQLMAAIPLVPGMIEPVTWQYNQFWIDKATLDVQERLIGAYTHEWVGGLKVIGIFEQVK